MNRPGYDSTRRNRNIGTAKSGHGKNNRLTIPRGWNDDRVFYEKLKNPVEISIPIGDSLRCLVEPPLAGFKHACTVDDVIAILRLIPISDLADISMIVLRQPKRKERILSPVWGRLVYWAEIGKLSGPAIYLEAQETSKSMKWPHSLDPAGMRELECLKMDGHNIQSDSRQHVVATTLDSTRNTQLYRTLPHEVGHYVDFLESVERPGRKPDTVWSALNDKYHRKSTQEKEAFAHRYADEFPGRPEQQALIPFERIFDPSGMRACGLDPNWFQNVPAS